MKPLTQDEYDRQVKEIRAKTETIQTLDESNKLLRELKKLKTEFINNGKLKQ